MNTTKRIGSYIDGKRILNQKLNTYYNINPATETIISEVEIADQSLCEEAISAAKNALHDWSSLTGAERGRILLNATQILRKRHDELVELEVLDTGKPIQEAKSVDIISGIESLEYFAGVAASLHGEHIQVNNAFVYTRREPLGVCAGIGAWNYPFQIACWKAAPALACGNTMVYKPSELTPTTALSLAEILIEAGVPNGVFNVLQGDESVGKMLTSHPDIAKVSLTGDVSTGKKVMRSAADTLKHVTMELGGKSPLIIFDDFDIQQAVSVAMLANFYTQGEICTNGTRVFVHHSIKEQFLEEAIKRTQTMRIGDPFDEQTQVGALISQAHLQKVLSYIEQGQKEGAHLLCGGKQLEGKGYFISPAIFDHCTDEMKIVQEEIFGPVMTVLEFSTEEEAIQRANNTPYGLASGVLTANLQRAHRVAAQLQSGVCWINNYNVTPIEMPFGGTKQSGFGRENGLAAIEHYTQKKSVYVELSDIEKYP